jgi:hypothetical protein
MHSTLDKYSDIREKVLRGTKRAIAKVYKDAVENNKDFIVSIDGKVVNLTKSKQKLETK